MSEMLKKILSGLFIVLMVVVVIAIAFGNPELKDAWGALRSLHISWIAGLFCCWFAYAFFDALGTWFCLRRQGFRLGLWSVLSFTLIGFFYSNITPGASGGQPMQVNSMRRAGVPVGHGTSIVTIRLIFNQLMVSVLSLAFWLFNRDFVNRQLGGAIWFVRVGWVINFAVVPLVLLQILFQCLCSTLSILALTGSIVFVYFAFGMSGTPWYHVLTMSLLLFISASYTPLPGASGAQEGGFMYYFNGIFTGGTKGLALLIWRFFTYYLFLFIGVIMVLLDSMRKKAGKQDRIPPAEED